MEILDEDIQTIRDALIVAPEYVKLHFESLVEQWESRVDAADDLKEANEKIDELEAQIIELDKQIESMESDHASEMHEMESALTKVRDWMHDTLVLDRPMTDPRKMLRIIEDALRS